MPNNEDIALSWIKRAKSSLAKAKIGINDQEIMLEDLCFDAQQCTEKALKSIFVLNDIQIPKTHSIGFLLNKLEENGIDIPDEIKEAVFLTEYSVETRYPGEYEPVSLEEYKTATKLSEKVLSFVLTCFPDKGIFKK